MRRLIALFTSMLRRAAVGSGSQPVSILHTELTQTGARYYQTVSADWVTSAGVPVAVTTSTGAKIGAARNALETRGTQLAGQARIARRTSASDRSEDQITFKTKRSS